MGHVWIFDDDWKNGDYTSSGKNVSNYGSGKKNTCLNTHGR